MKFFENVTDLPSHVIGFGRHIGHRVKTRLDPSCLAHEPDALRGELDETVVERDGCTPERHRDIVTTENHTGGPLLWAGSGVSHGGCCFNPRDLPVSYAVCSTNISRRRSLVSDKAEYGIKYDGIVYPLTQASAQDALDRLKSLGQAGQAALLPITEANGQRHTLLLSAGVAVSLIETPGAIPLRW